MPQFQPGITKSAVAPITVSPAGLQCTAEVFLGPDENTKIVSSGLVDFLSTGSQQSVSLPLTMPAAEGTYHVFIDVRAGGVLVGAYQALDDVTIVTEAGEVVTFTVKLADIPEYAAAATQWTIQYGGKDWGMWTSLGDPITVTGAKTGTIRATLQGGAYEIWHFSAGREFVNGKEYTFHLEDGYLASGIALTDLTIDPELIYQGETSTISVTVTNTEDSDQSYEVIFLLDGAEVGRQTVDLGPHDSQVVSIEVAPAQARTYQVQIESLIGVLQVEEACPDITEPSLESVSWKPKSEWPDNGAAFEGVIILPRPNLELSESVGVIAWLTDSESPSAPAITYLGEGRWQMEGEAGIPYYGPQHMCISHYETHWYGHCPANCGVTTHSEISAQDALNQLQEHLNLRCERGVQDHCRTATLSDIEREDKPIYTGWPYACPGDILTLYLKVMMLQPSQGGGAEIVQEWNIYTGLSYVYSR